MTAQNTSDSFLNRLLQTGLQVGQSYLQKTPATPATPQVAPAPTNYKPWLIGGIVAAVLVAVLAFRR